MDNATVSNLPEMFEDLIGELDSLSAGSASSVGLTASCETDSIHYLRQKVTGMRRQYRNVLLGLLVELAMTLMEEGIIATEALKWDGSLGPEEVKIMQRLGFLIDAYQVDTWYWEVTEMFRKLIMTSMLVVIYDGSAPHLAGSLLTTFVFILLHLQVHPYLNKGLNDFQRLALITQFLTIFGCIIFLMVGCLRDLHEVEPNEEETTVRNLLGIFILVINWVAAILYPAYRIFLFLSGFKMYLFSMFMKNLGTVASYVRSLFCCGTHIIHDAEAEDDLHLSAAIESTKLLRQQRISADDSQDSNGAGVDLEGTGNILGNVTLDVGEDEVQELEYSKLDLSKYTRRIKQLEEQLEGMEILERDKDTELQDVAAKLEKSEQRITQLEEELTKTSCMFDDYVAKSEEGCLQKEERLREVENKNAETTRALEMKEQRIMQLEQELARSKQENLHTKSGSLPHTSFADGQQEVADTTSVKTSRLYFNSLGLRKQSKTARSDSSMPSGTNIGPTHIVIDIGHKTHTDLKEVSSSHDVGTAESVRVGSGFQFQAIAEDVEAGASAALDPSRLLYNDTRFQVTDQGLTASFIEPDQDLSSADFSVLYERKREREKERDEMKKLVFKKADAMGSDADDEDFGTVWERYEQSYDDDEAGAAVATAEAQANTNTFSEHDARGKQRPMNTNTWMIVKRASSG